jgi:hypothetical protein
MSTERTQPVATLVNEFRSIVSNQVQRFALSGTTTLWLLITLIIQPAAAQNNTSPVTGTNCSPPPGLEQLFNFLNSVTELAFLGGVFLATLTFVVAGIAFILPGQDYNRIGRKIATNGFLGTILLLSANMITAWIVSNFPGVC